jgi:hypothetical protein
VIPFTSVSHFFAFGSGASQLKVCLAFSVRRLKIRLLHSDNSYKRSYVEAIVSCKALRTSKIQVRGSGQSAGEMEAPVFHCRR